jgi:hypothetical protein
LANLFNNKYQSRYKSSNQKIDVHPPTLETLENIMKLSPMIVQALWDKNKKFSLLQLPYITESHLKHFATKKVLVFCFSSKLKEKKAYI